MLHTPLALKASLGETHHEGKAYEVFAEGNASYDDASKSLVMELDSFLLSEDSKYSDATPHRAKPSWLPPKQTDREHVERREATDLGREIFQRWCVKIRNYFPDLIR